MSSNNPFDLPIFQPELPASFQGVQLGVTLSGANDRPYGFNLGLHVGDKAEQVHARRHQLEVWGGVPLVWLNQVHGCSVCTTEQLNLNGPAPFADADASITTSSQYALVVMTADCLPVVFVARNAANQAVGVGVAHAGWRGLQAGVLERCAKALAQQADVTVSQIHAWLGPAIGPDSFEVGVEVREAFLATDPQAELAFNPAHSVGKWMGNLYTLAQQRLFAHGVASVLGGGFDTMTDSRWYSHRRSVLNAQSAGRFATVVRLLP